MVISDRMIQLLNFRIQQEEYSSRLYLAMAVWLEYNGYNGAAKLWNEYSKEEQLHAKWAYLYLLNLNIQPKVQEIEKPENTFKGLPQIIAMSYKHEMDITNQCNDLAKEANKEGDFMTLELAQRYLKEQVEELSKLQYWLDRLEAFGNDKIALRLLDDEMGA